VNSHKREPTAGRRPLLVALLAFAVFSLGAVIGGAAVEYGVMTRAVGGDAPAAAKPGVAGDVAADLTRLKGVVPSQSHAMADVGYHWAGLWFAGQKGNWPLAQFFFDETRQHIKWTIAIRPVRKDPDGHDVDLKGIYDAVDSSAFATVKRAIEEKDSRAFDTAYKQSLEACYSCHKSSGKPYLRPMVPMAPPQTIINYDPNASWPQ
jgi:cytochrome c553